MSVFIPADGSADLLPNLQPSEVEFLDLLKREKDREVAVYKVKIRGKLYILKVFKGQPNLRHWDPDVVIRWFLCESNAYRLLKKKGLYARGVVPNFYGTIESIDVSLWPALAEYANDRLPPDAVLIEYIPNMAQLDLDTFSEDNVSRLSQILFEFHDMGLLHGDTYPRNMMVVRQQPRDRVLWIDFDQAQVAPPGLPRREMTQMHLDWERKWMESFERMLTEDAKEGKLNKTWDLYYE